ncbi:outer membrane protein, heavy metal efflux system [Methylomarinovum caldicuralii]|uniref:Outer membrane protein, heavy metal efflux system n=1 Tax=Methylomarinovum caldicuralii TaxID=438856 RepID=A0AAU9BQH3_9GAMM|nr:TolC family protein [Methylomarinovum caldicuralii]BCX80973.1 outer membrane protein, heavy metal efflux system [Methylomarinovum caldicuralii]
MKPHWWLGLILIFGIARADTTDALSLEQALAQAERRNPSLAAIRARYEALRAVPDQAGSLPDPEISLNALNLPVDTFDIPQEAMTQLQLGISQKFPFPGKLKLKAEAAEWEARAAGDDVEEWRLRLRRDVESLWWRLFYLDRALEIISLNQDLLRQFVEIAQTKYKVGQGLQQDVLLAQLELSRLLDRELQLQGLRAQEAARINALIDRPANSPVQLPPSAPRQLPEAAAEARLFTLAEHTRPLLARVRKQIKAAKTRVALAKKDFLPDFKLGATHGFRSGRNPDGSSRTDFLSLRLSMSVPLYFATKQARAVDQRQSELIRERFQWQDTWNRVRAVISAALADYRRARDQVALFDRGIIPQARQTVASMLAGYQVGKVDFLNLVSAQITLYNYEIQYWKTLAEARQALADLEAAVGKPVTSQEGDK